MRLFGIQFGNRDSTNSIHPLRVNAVKEGVEAGLSEVLLKAQAGIRITDFDNVAPAHSESLNGHASSDLNSHGAPDLVSKKKNIVHLDATSFNADANPEAKINLPLKANQPVSTNQQKYPTSNVLPVNIFSNEAYIYRPKASRITSAPTSSIPNAKTTIVKQLGFKIPEPQSTRKISFHQNGDGHLDDQPNETSLNPHDLSSNRNSAPVRTFGSGGRSLSSARSAGFMTARSNNSSPTNSAKLLRIGGISSPRYMPQNAASLAIHSEKFSPDIKEEDEVDVAPIPFLRKANSGPAKRESIWSINKRWNEMMANGDGDTIFMARPASRSAPSKESQGKLAEHRIRLLAADMKRSLKQHSSPSPSPTNENAINPFKSPEDDNAQHNLAPSASKPKKEKRNISFNETVMCKSISRVEDLLREFDKKNDPDFFLPTSTAKYHSRSHRGLTFDWSDDEDEDGEIDNGQTENQDVQQTASGGEAEALYDRTDGYVDFDALTMDELIDRFTRKDSIDDLKPTTQSHHQSTVSLPCMKDDRNTATSSVTFSGDSFENYDKSYYRVTRIENGHLKSDICSITSLAAACPTPERTSRSASPGLIATDSPIEKIQVSISIQEFVRKTSSAISSTKSSELDVINELETLLYNERVVPKQGRSSEESRISSADSILYQTAVHSVESASETGSIGKVSFFKRIQETLFVKAGIRKYSKTAYNSRDMWSSSNTMVEPDTEQLYNDRVSSNADPAIHDKKSTTRWHSIFQYIFPVRRQPQNSQVTPI